MPELLEYLPDGLEALRHLLEKRDAGQEPRSTGSVLHGDFWPGNILWQEDRIAAVIDWEDAAVGDPLSDLPGMHGPLGARAAVGGREALEDTSLPEWRGGRAGSERRSLN